MNEIDNNKIIEDLKNRIDKLEKGKNKKGIWEIIPIISSFLIPLSIVFAGYFLSEAERIAKLESQKKEIQLAEIKSKVDQAQLVSHFLEALVDTNAYKRQLAIKSILLALPEKGAELVEEISKNDPDEKVKVYAKQSLEDNSSKTRKELIQKIFSPVKQIRLNATNELLENWSSDQDLVGEIIDYASLRLGEEQENKSGLINTIVVLNSVDQSVLDANTGIVKSFIERVELLQGRKQTQEFLSELKLRLK